MPRISRVSLFLIVSVLTACSTLFSPRVESTVPASGDNLLSTNVVVRVVFSKEMDRPSTEQAFTLTLSYDRGNKLEGSFAWTDDRTMEFTPYLSKLEWPARYVITLQTPAMDRDGNHLEASYFSEFSLLSNLARPVVTATRPVDGSTNFSVYSNIIIDFSLNMATNETRQAFSISPNVGGDVNIYSNRLIFTPDNPFQNGVYYTVTLAASARATNSVSLLDDLELYFLPGQNFTVPRLLAVRTNISTFNFTNRQSNIEKTSTNLVLVFNTDMDRASVENGLTLEPTINHYLDWPSNNVARINMLDMMLPSTNYRLTLDKNISSVYGRTMLEKTNIAYTTDGPDSILARFLELECTNSFYWLTNRINYFPLGASNSMAVTVRFSSLSGMDWISIFENSEVDYISGEDGLKQGEISDIVPLAGNTNDFIFVFEKLALSNIYKLSLKGGANAIQDIRQNHLEHTIDIYFTATN